MSYDEIDEYIEYLPERNWKERYGQVSLIPREIRAEYYEIRRRFGIDVANLVLLMYRKWGARPARALASKILSFDSFDSLIRFLKTKIQLFDAKSRKILANLIYSYEYNFHFEKLLKLIAKEEKSCPGLRTKATALFHCLASRGLFYNEECLISYVKYELGCGGSIQKCKSTTEAIRRVETCIGGGSG